MMNYCGFTAGILANMFITGLDCDTIVNGDCQGDGQRDITLG